MKITLFFLFITFLFIISGCAVPPAVSISTLNRTGYILDEGRKEKCNNKQKHRKSKYREYRNPT